LLEWLRDKLGYSRGSVIITVDGITYIYRQPHL